MNKTSINKPHQLNGFLPFVIVVFINAFVDLGHKIIIQNTVFKVYDGEIQVMLTALVNGLILLPFVLLFSPAGFISDRFRKPMVMRVSAAVAVLLTLFITLAYYRGWFVFAFAMTFLLAVQSAFYSPAKYGYIKELGGAANLAPMNAVVQAVTMIGILMGVFLFSVLFENSLQDITYRNESELLSSIAPIGWVLVACSIIELLFTFKLPIASIESTSEQTNIPRFRFSGYVSGHYLIHNFRLLLSNRNIWLSIVGLSMFWGISQVMLAAFPALAKEVLAETNTIVIQGILACSGFGLIIGSTLAGRASRQYIETGFVAVGAIGIVACLFILTRVDSSLAFALVILILGFFGGMFVVPLNAIIQFQADSNKLGTVLAGNNWVQNIVMLAFLCLTMVMVSFGISTLSLFYAIAFIALVGALYTIYQLPQSLIRLVISKLFASRYRIRVQGFDNLPSQGAVLMLGNHISWLDWAMIQIACPRPVHFVMHRTIYERWYLKWFLDFFGVIPIAGGSSRQSLEEINALLKAGEVVCLFPEGAISRNGQLGEFKHGFEKTVEAVEGIILPFYLRGLWGSRFSRASERMKILRSAGLRRDIIVAFGRPLSIDSKAAEVKNRVFDLSIDAWETYTRTLDSLPLAWIRTVRSQGKNLCMSDAVGSKPLTGRTALTASLAFSRLIGKRSPEQNIGLLLPTSSAGMLTNMAVLMLGKTVVNLNYTASLEALSAAIDKAGIRSIYTSTRFVKKLQQRGIELDSLFEKVQVFYLEELKEEITLPVKLGIIALIRLLPARLLYALFGKSVDNETTAAILFSSGSEGTPKGVMLTHRNIISNIRQVADVLDIQEQDVIMGSLPQFHAFGLTVTGMLPLIEGIPVIFHPDPTDVLNIAKAIARHRITILCGTSTFLRLYVRNRRVHPLMLESVRVIVAGAERLSDEVRTSFESKFNKRIYEGYGTTETTPVASVNIPDRIDTHDWQVQEGSKPGSVGLPLPGSSFRIVDPQTLEELPLGKDGLILIGGTQIMKGYLPDAGKTDEVITELDGKRWYKSGDKGHLDEDGFLTIVDRYSRFAKIGGEMISLGAIEQGINRVLDNDDIEVLATAIPDGKKGEKVVLLFAGDIDEPDLKEEIKTSGMNSLMQPSMLLKVDTIPKLGTGKSDFETAKAMALEDG